MFEKIIPNVATPQQEYDLEKKILTILMMANVLFFSVELVAAIVTNSKSVLMDTFYDGIDAAMTVACVRLLPLLNKPVSEKRPYGYSQFESFMVVLNGILLSTVTIILVVTSVQSLLDGGNVVKFGYVAAFQLFATAFGIIMLMFITKAKSKVDSPLIEAQRQSWMIDCFSSMGMAIAFLLPVFTEGTRYAFINPYLDQFIAIFLAMYILPRPLMQVKKGFRDMFLLAPEESILKIIKLNAEIVIDDNEFKDYVIDVVRTGRKLWVSIYFTTNTNTVNLDALNTIHQELSLRLQEEFGEVDLEFIPDL